MMLFLLPVVFAILYAIKYCRGKDPIPGDIISSCVTLTIALCHVVEYGVTVRGMLLYASLLVEALADFCMYSLSLNMCLVLFSLGHLAKQNIALLLVIPQSLSELPLFMLMIVCYFISVILTTLLGNIDIKRDDISVRLYTIIITFTWILISLARGHIDRGYLCYVLSDIIIGYEVLFQKMQPRWLRIIIVPSLYWLGQYLTGINLLS